MRIKILAVGRKMPSWVEQGCEEYQKRLPRELELQVQEIAPGERRGNTNSNQARDEEGQRILARLDADDWMIALDERGKAVSTRDLAEQLSNWQMEGLKPAFVIGGADGLSSECLARARQKWSLSMLTFPHPLVRVLLVEQLYRAAMINANHPYHRD